jgi:hypothetical protein
MNEEAVVPWEKVPEVQTMKLDSRDEKKAESQVPGRPRCW